MRLETIELSNFQGIKSAKFDFAGRDASIFGNNATGKSTVFNALTWLLFDKASNGKKGFSPKTLDADGAISGLDHGVLARFVLGCGREISLEKILREVWTKKKGAAKQEFSGHSTDYFVDGVPAREKEYLAALDEHFGGCEVLKMLIMPAYFANELPWAKRREVLLGMCGDINDTDVIKANPALAGLAEHLGKYSIEEYRKIVDAKRKEINRELATIPARIDEAHKAMPDISNIDIRKIDMDIARAQVNIDECEEAKRQIAANSEDDAARCALAELQTKLACAKAGYAADNAKADEAAHEKIQKLKQEGRESADRLNALKDDLKLDLAKLDAMATLQKELADKYRAIRDENWAGSEICPTCEQSLPDDKIAASRDAFNQNKSKALEAINQRGKDECSKDMLAALDTKTKALKDEIEALSAKVLESADIVRKAQNDMPKPAPFEQTAEYIEIAQLIANLQNSTAANSDNAEKISEQDKEIRQYRLQIEEHMTKRTLFDLATRQQVRIDELSANEKRLADEYEKIEAALYLCDEFTKAKVSMLDDRINSHFKSVKFRLFETLINGGIKEGCEVVIPSPDGALVPYGFANHAGRINAGLEIIGALGEHYGIHPPVFVDNAESITEIINIKNQLIRLMVSEKDKKLRMEVSA